MGKSKAHCIDLKEFIIDLNKSGESLGAISKQLQVPNPNPKPTKYKVHGTVVSMPRSRRKHKQSPASGRKLVRMVKSQPQTTGVKVHSQVCFASPWAERLLQTRRLKARQKFAADRMDGEKKNLEEKSVVRCNKNWVVWPQSAAICLETRRWSL